jgi:2'-5' RNA ligase
MERALDKIRVFIAVPVTDLAADLVGKIEDELRGAGADVKWVAPRNIHITLKFLGNVGPEELADLRAALAASLGGGEAFDMTLCGMGTFPPGRKSVRVVWVGITGGTERLAEAAAKAEDACVKLGFPKEARPFSPHLTIGRVRSESGRATELADRVAKLTFNSLKVKIDRVNLMRSELSPKGPTYTVLESFALCESGKGGGAWI